jgi:hypothetical protein
MDRKIPKLSGNMVIAFLGINPKIKNEEQYLDAIEKYEVRLEARLDDVLWSVDIKGSVKNDRLSLPYTNEIKMILRGGTDMDAAFAFRKVMRPMIQHVLRENLTRVRYYVLVNVLDGFMGFGAIEYIIRYYIPKKSIPKKLITINL